MLSYWEKEHWQRPFDMLVIGGGITGYSAAIEYKTYRPDLRVGVIEKDGFETSASTKNAGFACFGSVTEMLSDFKTIGEDGLRELVRNRWEGLRLLRQRVGDRAMAFNESGGFEIFKDSSEYEKAASEIPRLNTLLRTVIGGDIFREVNDRRNFSFAQVEGMIENRYEGQLDPSLMLARLKQIARTLDIENMITKAESIDEKSYEVDVVCSSVVLRSHQVIVAVNGMARKLLDLEVNPARAQVLITEPIEELGWQGTFHFQEGFYYFRNVGERVLIGGGRNLDLKNEETFSQDTTELIQNSLEELLNQNILPNRKFKIDQRWAGTMGVGPSKEPIVKHTSDRVISAVRLGGMGVAIGSLVGSQAAHLAIE